MRTNGYRRELGSDLRWTGILSRGSRNIHSRLTPRKSGYKHQPDGPYWLGTDFTLHQMLNKLGRRKKSLIISPLLKASLASYSGCAALTTVSSLATAIELVFLEGLRVLRLRAWMARLGSLMSSYIRERDGREVGKSHYHTSQFATTLRISSKFLLPCAF